MVLLALLMALLMVLLLVLMLCWCCWCCCGWACRLVLLVALTSRHLWRRLARQQPGRVRRRRRCDGDAGAADGEGVGGYQERATAESA